MTRAFCVLFVLPMVGTGAVVRVAPQGGDFAKIQSAVDGAVEGDTIEVQDGVYAEAVAIGKAGIVLRCANRHGAGIRSPSGTDAIRLLEGANYITIDGFDIMAGENGIQANSSGTDHCINHHTVVRNCHIHDCGAGGVQLNHGDYRTVENNIVHHCASVSRYYHSGISLWQPIALDSDTGFHNIVRGNICYGNRNPPGGTDGNGIIIDDFRHTQFNSTVGEYPNKTLVENNCVFDNGARGIEVYLSSHVTVRNNTAWHNNTDTNLDATWRGELYSCNTSDVQWYNNIAVAGSAIHPDNTAILDGQYGGYSNENVLWAGNLLFDSDMPEAKSIKIQSSTSPDDVLAGNFFGKDPLFAAPDTGASADFHLLSTSPAIATALKPYAAECDLEGARRDSSPDIGAYEFVLVVWARERVSRDGLHLRVNRQSALLPGSTRHWALSGSVFDLRGRLRQTAGLGRGTSSMAGAILIRVHDESRDSY